MSGRTSPVTLRYLLGRLWHHLSRRRRRQFGALLLLMLGSAVTEVISLGAVVPFLGALADPERVYRNPFVRQIADAWGIESSQRLVVVLTVLFVVAAVAAAAVRTLLLWVSTRLAFASGADLSIEVYRRTLYQPYPVHVSRNSSSIISAITTKVSGAVTVLHQVLALISATVLLVAITAMLLAIQPAGALIATVLLGIIYALITWSARRRLRQNSRDIADHLTQVVKSLQEGLGGIRDVLLDGTQALYVKLYSQANYPLRRAQANNAFISGSPRFAMEALGMLLIAILAFALSRNRGGIAAAIPLLGALALGAQRILPALQQIFSSWAIIAGNHVSLAETVELLDQPVLAELIGPVPRPLAFNDCIEFRNVNFRYATDGSWVLNSIDLTIPQGSRIGVVGRTGSGKSTLLDLLMGLLMPSEGDLLVDGEAIRGSRVRAWQRAIAHVPQSIYLADTTLAENIAFGVARDSIDMDRVREAARQAQLTDFIESRREGYDAIVGERGVRLSGGQRQRIGIARALYKRASVLVFDEATSALDSSTEHAVMEAIESLRRDLTIVLIAHRLTTVRWCDSIVELGGGRILARGSYNELVASSATFRELVHTTSPRAEGAV